MNIKIKLSPNLRRMAGVAGMATTIRGRNRQFIDRKKQASKHACRHPVSY